jgi:hypothetical protein
MAQAIHIPTQLRARIAWAEAKPSTNRSRSASVGLFSAGNGLAPPIGAFLRYAQCGLRTLQHTAIMARRMP